MIIATYLNWYKLETQGVPQAWPLTRVARASTLQGELCTARLYCFRGAENFRNNMHYVNHRVFDEDMKVQFKTTNKYRIFWPITRG